MISARGSVEFSGEVRPWDWTRSMIQWLASQEPQPFAKPLRRSFTFSPQFKAQVVLDVLTGLRSQAEAARQTKLKPELIARWKFIALEHRAPPKMSGTDLIV